MPAPRKGARTAEPAAVANNETPHENKKSEYELSREQRIRENRERMGKLGIFDLSLTLKLNPKKSSHNHKPKTPPPPLNPSAPVRRSSRLQNVTPVSYSEAPVKKNEFVENGRIVIGEGSKPEAYTEEHEKLLGNTDKPWTLFVDGVGKDGKRIYDSVHGKTCHQCRQKTLGYRTHCSRCNMVQGQFCGDCLYMRYGEHVLEALQNPTWLCPVCRGICNCSLCRQAKGWAPTGPLYKKISALGYKSVAHYLIQTRRKVDVEKNADTSNPISAKRSLPFSDVDDRKSPEVNENHLGSLKPLAETEGDGAEVSAKGLLLFSDEQDQPEKDKFSDTLKNADASNPVSAKRSLPFSNVGNKKSPEVNENHLGSSKPLAETEGDGAGVSAKDQPEKVKCPRAPKPLQLENKCSGTKKRLASSSKPTSDSIAGRLRSRLKIL